MSKLKNEDKIVHRCGTCVAHVLLKHLAGLGNSMICSCFNSELSNCIKLTLHHHLCLLDDAADTPTSRGNQCSLLIVCKFLKTQSERSICEGRHPRDM